MRKVMPNSASSVVAIRPPSLFAMFPFHHFDGQQGNPANPLQKLPHLLEVLEIGLLLGLDVLDMSSGSPSNQIRAANDLRGTR